LPRPVSLVASTSLAVVASSRRTTRPPVTGFAPRRASSPASTPAAKRSRPGRAGDLVALAPGRARAIHASLAEAVRLYGLGVGKKHLHASFWRFCFSHSARVPQELEHEETQQLISMWVDANRPLAKVYLFPSRATR
jgi:hypothetical protein